MGAVALSASLLACRAESKPGPSTSATDATTSTLDATPAADASHADASPVQDALTDTRADGVRLDTPPWPAGTKTLRLTWVLYPKVDEPGKGTQRFVVELVVRAGSVARRFSVMQLGTNDQSTYAFDVKEQLGCRGIKPPKVASLWLGGGGYVSYDVARVGDELVLSKVDLCALGGSDGKCDLDPSPVRPGKLASIPIPHEVTFEERYHVIDDATHEHDEICPAKSQ